MAKTEEKPKKKPARPKKGLHGWKAALTVFGCGTLAAFGVFGILIGMASMFLGFSSEQESMTSPEEDPISGIGQTAIPRDSTGTGDIDLCGKTIHQVDEVHAIRQDSGGEYSDPGEGEIPRSVIDECQWKIFPALDGASSVRMDFSYEAFITDEAGEEASGLAAEDFEERSSGFDSLDIEELSSGDAGLRSESHYVYGISEQGETTYALVVRSGGTVYEMIFTAGQENSGSEAISVKLFENERDWIVSYIEARLGTVGPR